MEARSEVAAAKRETLFSARSTAVSDVEAQYLAVARLRAVTKSSEPWVSRLRAKLQPRSLHVVLAISESQRLAG